MKRSNVFIQMKDHKESFDNLPKACIINRNQKDIGKVCSKIVRRTIGKIKQICKLNLWIDSGETAKWFMSIENKHNKNFIQLDIKKCTHPYL